MSSGLFGPDLIEVKLTRRQMEELFRAAKAQRDPQNGQVLLQAMRALVKAARRADA